MLNAMIRAMPLATFLPFRRAIVTLNRRNPLRIASTLLVRTVARAFRTHLAARLGEIRPLDAPGLSFEAVDSMVMDAVYWVGVHGYEGTVAGVWTLLCRNSTAVLEIGGNIGLFSVLGGKAAGGRYTVVEPLPINAAVLRANLARNGLHKVEVLQAAAIPGDTARNVVLNLPDEGREMLVGAHLLEDSEVRGRNSASHLTVAGLPVRALAAGRDLIKIDAEGIEATLLTEIRDLIVTARPALMIEVLPEAVQLGELLASLAQEAGYHIHVLPEWGSDRIVTIPAERFTSLIPSSYNSKDVVLSTAATLGND